MTILSVDEFCAALAPDDRLMSLDVGSKTIGLATAIWGRDEVMPLKTLNRVKFTRDAEALKAVMGDYNAWALVIGWPLLPDGTPGKRCQSVRDFTAELDRFLADPQILITFWDERFSTARGDEVVDNIGKTAGKSVRKNRDEIIDALAAQEILRDFIGV